MALGSMGMSEDEPCDHVWTRWDDSTDYCLVCWGQRPTTAESVDVFDELIGQLPNPEATV